jgi:two-component system, response regulator, stage 0 sporulation protein F
MTGNILIVDHDLANRGFLRECLEGEGHRVTAVSSGADVLSFVTTGLTNVIIMNVDTPGVRDKSMLLRARRAGETRMLLVVSERGDPFLKEAMDLGVYGFIYKPFNLNEVCTLVHHLAR